MTTIAELKILYPILIAQIEQEAVNGINGDYVSTIKIARTADDQIGTWTETIKDREGLLIGSRVNIYNYDKDGILDIINHKEYEKEILVVNKNIIHHGKKVSVVDLGTP